MLVKGATERSGCDFKCIHFKHRGGGGGGGGVEYSGIQIYIITWNERHKTSLWKLRFRKYFGAVRQHAINWATIDSCRHVVSLGHNELNLLVQCVPGLRVSCLARCLTSMSSHWAVIWCVVNYLNNESAYHVQKGVSWRAGWCAVTMIFL